MMEKTGKSSEFSAAYKLKSGSSLKKKDARLHRRSIEWKSLRGEEVDKRRNLKNLSPLQEIKENQHQCSMYKDKTPTKPNKGAKPNDMREKLKRWREEKALKKKTEAQEKAKKKPFIIKHVIPTENMNPSAVKREIADSSKSKSNTMPLQPKPQSKETRANKSATVSKKQSSSIMQKDSSAKKAYSKPVTERVTRSTKSRSAVQNGGQQLKDKAGSCKKSATKRGKASTVDLRKVSTARGMSFAPEEFAFTAPNNLASFMFKPLSPASCENFLFSNNPDETAAFVATDAGRCSTPKKERAGSNMTSSDEEKTEIKDKKAQDKQKKDDSRAETSIETTKTRRQTRSQTKSISSKNDSLSIMDISENEPRSRTGKSSNQRMSSSSPSKQTSSKTPSRSRKSLRSGSIASVEEGSRKRSSSRELPSCSRLRKRSRSQEDRGTDKRRKSRRSVSINTKGNVQVDLITSPEQQPKSKNTEHNMETDDKENTVEEEEKSVGPNEPHDLADDEMDSNRSVKLSNHSLTVEVTEKHSPGSSLKARTSIGSGLENTKKVPSPSVENMEAVNNLSAKNRKMTRRSLNPEPKMSDDTKELAADVEENIEVFEEEPSSTPKRRSRRSIRLRPDFAEIPESFASGDKENAKPSRPTRRSVAVVDGFKLPSESLSAKRSKPKQRRHTLHIAKSPEEWVEILKSSPMVEMSRRTPKQKSPVSRLPALDLELDLDDLNLPPKEEIQNDLDISKVIMSNLSAEEADLCPDKAAVEPMEVNSSEQAVEQVDTTQTQDQCSASTSSEQLDQEHDVKYFRNLLKSETDRFNVMCEKWEAINRPELSEDVQGQIRTVIGQAQLIISQRFKQFSGLVDSCEFKLGEKETTCTDLQGFWDMIYFQVEDVDKKFEDLQKQREAGWVKKSPEPVKKLVKKKNVNKPVLKKPVKSKFAAFKASLKSSAAPAQTIEHDWGLFKVTSPLRKPSYHCEAGSPKPKPAESPMPLQPRPDLSQPEEENQSQPVPVVQQNPPTIAVEDVPVVRTPKRQSYLPIIPSPLLQDCTPQPRFTRSLLKHTPLNGTEDKIETPRPRRQSLRRSINLKRKSVSFVEEPEKPESPANESFSKYLQPSQSIPEESNSPISIMDSYFSEAASSSLVLSSGGKSAKSTLKSDRRRSARRSVSFCSPLPEKDKSFSLRQPPTPHRSLVEEPDSDSDNQSDTESKFATLNVAFTPITRSTRSRPSLLYTPPDLGSPSQKNSAADVAVGTLISFSP